MLVNQGVETPVPEKVRGGGVRHMMIFIKEEIIECRRGGGGGVEIFKGVLKLWRTPCLLF